jgi:transposase
MICSIMTLPAIETLDELSRAELLVLVKQLIGTVQQLQAKVAELEAERPQSRQPPAASCNSSQPPSRGQKAALSGKRRRRRRARPYHARALRPLVEEPDQVVEAPVLQCAQCQTDLRRVAPCAVVRRQITGLPAIRPVVSETRQHEVVCPRCRHGQGGAVPEGLGACRTFGPRLAAAGVYLKRAPPLSYERLTHLCRDLFGVAISEGGVAALPRRAGEAAQPAAAARGGQVRQRAIIGREETSARVGGHNRRQWVLLSVVGVSYLIRPSRGAQVIAEAMGERRAECWGCDRFSAQLQAPTERLQLCLAHRLRDLRRLIEPRPRVQWAGAMQASFREATHPRKRRAELSPRGYTRRGTELERRLAHLLAQRVQGAEAGRRRERSCLHRGHLFVFLHHPGVPPDNNACERALRPSVIHRKVTNGFRSEWGAHAYAALATVIETAKLQGRNVFDTLVALMGPPVLPFVAPQNP